MPDALSTIDRRSHAHDAAYRALVAVLKTPSASNFDLPRVVRTWVTMGGAGDTPPNLPDAPNLMPAVRLIPSAAGREIVAQGVWDSPVDVTITAAVQGSSWRDLSGLADAICRRLRPAIETTEETEVEAAMEAAGVHEITIVSEDVPANDRGEPIATATVRVRLEMYVDE